MNDDAFTISGNLVDVLEGKIFPATLHIESGKIIRIVPESKKYDTFITPGLVDAHVHIESSMLTPAEFARVAMTHGIIAAVCDPHEIANVLGMAGIDYMLENARTSPFMFAFGAPSCVPATTFETSGATIGVTEVAALLERKEITHLSEVMNYPGVIGRDPDVMAKIELAKRYGKPIDGHAPGISGEALKNYVMAGITTDHETSSLDEAIEKIGLGMKILIRDGSAARDFEKLHSLIDNHSDMCMFCSDDKHPDDLAKGHMDAVVRRAVAYGHDPLKVLKCASLNPVTHYSLSMGLLRQGDPADFLVVDTLGDFRVLKTYIKGSLVADNGKSSLAYEQPEIINVFHAGLKHKGDFALSAGVGYANIIHASDGSLLTGWLKEAPGVTNGYVMTDLNRDILKIAVVNRYFDNPPLMGLVKGFGLRKGAIASSVAHDSHNIVAVGVTDEDIAHAVNTVIANRGGLALAWGNVCEDLPLPIAGLMSDADGLQVATRYSRLERLVLELGSPMTAPFITLSFMALLVIPHLKMSDHGLFDAQTFRLIDLFEHKSMG
jgi:adenine deaminase